MNGPIVFDERIADTWALLALADGELPEQAAASLRRASEAYVSSVSAWEVAIRVASRKLRLQSPPAQWFSAMLDRYDLREIPLESVTACAAAALVPVHRDPFDRVIVALAQARGLTVLISDENIPRYGVTTLW